MNATIRAGPGSLLPEGRRCTLPLRAPNISQTGPRLSSDRPFNGGVVSENDYSFPTDEHKSVGIGRLRESNLIWLIRKPDALSLENCFPIGTHEDHSAL